MPGISCTDVAGFDPLSVTIDAGVAGATAAVLPGAADGTAAANSDVLKAGLALIEDRGVMTGTLQ
jgi:hypothetical protein